MNPVVYSGKGSYSATSMIKGMRDIAKIMNLLNINPNHFSCAEYSKALNATPPARPKSIHSEKTWGRQCGRKKVRERWAHDLPLLVSAQY